MKVTKSVNEMKTSLHTHFTQEGKKKISKTNFKTWNNFFETVVERVFYESFCPKTPKSPKVFDNYGICKITNFG